MLEGWEVARVVQAVRMVVGWAAEGLVEALVDALESAMADLVVVR